jgi:hypothetical protein
LLRHAVSQAIAAGGYLPLARGAAIAERMGLNVTNVPLSVYCRRSFYVMRTDALDRFGTRLEQRFTKDQISAMMEAAGFNRIRFGDAPPYWCAVDQKS